MKRLLLLFVAIALLCCACGKNAEKADDNGVTMESPDVNVENVKPNDEEKIVDWKTVYSDFLIALNERVSSESYSALNYIGLNDLTFDGVPELIVSDDAASAAASFAIYQIVDGEIERIFGHSAVVELSGEKYLLNGDEYFNCYSHFEGDWLRLMKNKENGELKYMFTATNGSDTESFESIYSATVDSETGVLSIEEEFYKCEYNRYGEYAKDAPETDDYRVGGAVVSEDEYNKEFAEINSQWSVQDVNCVVMLPAYRLSAADFKQKMELDASPEKIAEFMDLYKPEI